VKEFISKILKSVQPRYYSYLGDQSLKTALKYFLSLLLLSFIIMSVLSIPKILYFKSDLEKGLLDIVQFKVDTKLQTNKPIRLPANDPIIAIDTTGNETLNKKLMLITSDSVYYSFFGKDKQIKVNGFDLNSNRADSLNLFTFLAIVLLPFAFIFFYLLYAVKYLLTLLGVTIATFIVAKIMRNRIRFGQTIVLSFFTATPMILLEILTIPFSMKKYLIIYSPSFGLYFSLIALTIYFTLFLTALRLNGSKQLQQ
jgi:hypothetical protein